MWVPWESWCTLSRRQIFHLVSEYGFHPKPANNIRMTFKYDGRLGDDDPLLWPQPYVGDICLFPGILHNQDISDPSVAVLYKPYHSDYFVSIDGSLSGLGVLSLDIVKQLKACLESCKVLHQENEDNPDLSKTELGARHITTLTHGIGHLERLPMSRKQQRFIFSQQQRCLIEFSAMIRYVSTHQARMNSPVVDMEVGLAGEGPRAETRLARRRRDGVLLERRQCINSSADTHLISFLHLVLLLLLLSRPSRRCSAPVFVYAPPVHCKL